MVQDRRHGQRTAGGTITYVERDADLLKVGGENVSAREVEEVAAAVAGVAKVAVVGKKHDFLSQVAVAFVIKSADAPADSVLTQQVIEACSGRLASFKVPRAVYYVDEFPTGNFDKLLKNRLPRDSRCGTGCRLTSPNHPVGIVGWTTLFTSRCEYDARNASARIAAATAWTKSSYWCVRPRATA